MRYTNNNSSFRILHCNDTDVTWLTIVSYSSNVFIVTRTFDNEFLMKFEPKVEVWSQTELQREFELQYGSPMMYMSQEDFDWLIHKEDVNRN